MILGRLRRARRISALVVLLCTLFAVVDARAGSVAGERQIHQPFAATVDMLTAVRAAVVEVARTVPSQDRSATGFFLAPHDAPAVTVDDGDRTSNMPVSLEAARASLPRRLAFRYEATAPPSAF